MPALALAGLVLTSISLPGERTDGPRLLPSDPDSSPDLSSESARRAPRVLIVGAGAVGRQLAQSLESGGKRLVVGFVDDSLHEIGQDPWPILGNRYSTAKLVSEYAIDEVCLAYAPTWQQDLAEQLAAECPKVRLQIVPTPYEALLRLGKVQSHGDIALVSLTTQPGRGALLAKRAFDLTVAILVLVLLAPLWALIAVLIKLTSKGPVIFAQERVGLFGRTFHVLKFRTMQEDAEVATGPVLSDGKLDARLTSIGRYLRLFRVDEVPQLWNILRGEMSLVGPRPERPIFVEKYNRMLPSYARRHEVQPGITGLAQVYGGYHTDGRDKLRFDLIYVSHLSFWFDLYILMRTIHVVLVPDDRH